VASIGQYQGIGLLSMIFGPAIACVRTAISANATAQTAINIGSVATAGASGNADTTPPSNSIILVCHPSGTGASQNLYSISQAFTVTSSSSTAITIPSQDIGNAISTGDFVFLLGINTSTSVTTAPSIPIFLNTLYIGQSTQAWSTTVTDAQLLAGEPTATGSYARIACLNSGGAGGVATTNWGTPTTSAEIETVANLVAQAFAVSTTNWSTTTSPLASWFAADLVTLDAGHVVWSGANTPATDIVNGAGVTLSYAVNALKATVQ
jgi:hypothetical protein